MITLTKDQAAKLSENGTLTIVRPLREQPPEGGGFPLMGSKYLPDTVSFTDDPHGHTCIECDSCKITTIKLQFPVGKSVKCKWVKYKSGAREERMKTVVSYIIYDEVITTVAANRVCPVQKVTNDKWESMGMGDWSHNHREWPVSAFNSLYAKPVMRVVDGKKQYVAWAWDWESWIKLYEYDKRWQTESSAHFDRYNWKDLQLTVHCNPFVEIVTVSI